MARRLRIQYEDAIYHVMARGNGRQDIVGDDEDRRRVVACLERAVRRSGWVAYAYVLMTNRLHLVVKTPRANLAGGMQLFLSAYANGWARRHRRPGHLFQGRYRAEPVEDESYLWTLSRYVHLNPVRAGLVAAPQDWPWSSCPGYFRRSARRDWVAYDELLAAWGGEFGGGDAARLYRRYVTAGVLAPPPAPWGEARQGWMIGSDRVPAEVRRRGIERTTHDLRREARLLRGPSLEELVEAVCARYEVDRDHLARRGSRSVARAALAYLAHRHAECSRSDLVPVLGLSRPESVPNLSRRFASLLLTDRCTPADLAALKKSLGISDTPHDIGNSP